MIGSLISYLYSDPTTQTSDDSEMLVPALAAASIAFVGLASAALVQNRERKRNIANRVSAFENVVAVTADKLDDKEALLFLTYVEYHKANKKINDKDMGEANLQKIQNLANSVKQYTKNGEINTKIKNAMQSPNFKTILESYARSIGIDLTAFAPKVLTGRRLLNS